MQPTIFNPNGGLGPLNRMSLVATIFSNPEVERKMVEYCIDTYRGPLHGRETYINRMKEHVLSGERLIQQMRSSTALEETTKRNISDVIWYLMALAAAKDQQFVSGTFRVYDPEGILFKFLERCQPDRNGGCYARLSSHFRVEKGQPRDSTLQHPAGSNRNQRGIDMRHIELPGNKHTVLFSQLFDGSTWIKPERHGLPPFFESGYRTLTNFGEAIKHCFDYVLWRFNHGDYSTWETQRRRLRYMPRRENLGNAVRREYRFAMRLIRRSVMEKNEQQRLHRIEKDGLNHGLSAMISGLQSEIDKGSLWMREGLLIELQRTCSQLQERMRHLNGSCPALAELPLRRCAEVILTPFEKNSPLRD